MEQVSLLVVGELPEPVRNQIEAQFDPVGTHWAKTAREAIGFTTNLTFDIIFADVDSIGFLGLRMVQKTFHGVPIIAFSKSDEEGFRAVEEGAEDHLPKKDLAPRQFRRSVRFALARQRRSNRSVIETGEFNVAARTLVASATLLAGDLEAS
jgi:DNA-binding response OmpR family regulator